MVLERDPGSTANSAYDLGNLSGTQSVTEFIGSTDSTDIYKFSLTETNKLNLDIDYSSSDLAANLFIDSNKNGQIDDGERLKYDDGSIDINQTLGAADYFISVFERSGYTANTNYSLNLSATPTPPSLDNDPGSTVDKAHSFGNLSGTQSVTEFIGSTDSTDIYKFSLTETSKLNLDIDYSSSDLAANLFIDSNKNGQIDDGERLKYDDGSIDINQTLGAADYFISVFERSGYTANTNYSLNLSATPTPPSLDNDPGSTTNDAHEFQYINLDTSEDYRQVREFIGSTDDVDVYKFSLAQTTSVNLDVDYSSSDLAANLFIDSNKNGQIDDGERLKYDDGSIDINQTLGAADYFISVFERSGYTANTNYDLDVKFVADPLSVYVSVAAEDAIAEEEGTNAAKFRITRDAGSNEAKTINYVIATGNGQATNGVDYEELSGSVILPAEQGYVDVFVNPIDDDVVEANQLEEVTITLTNTDGDVGISPNKTATVTIEDNDVVPTFTIEAADDEAKEEEAETGTFRISHDGNTAISHTVNYQIASGNNQAVNGFDYAELSGSVTIPAEQDYIDLTITPTDDREIEETERVTITVKDVDGNLGTEDNQTATVTIEDNDVPPTFTIEATDNRAAEAEASTGVFRITRDGDTIDAQVVNYEIATGENQATNGVDYAELSGTVTIPEGEASVNLVITPTDDEEIETDERIAITVRDFDGNLGTADNQTASVIIEDNDVAPPVFSIEAIDSGAAEAETSTGVFRITRDGDTTDAQVVNYQIATGNNQAVNGVDYGELSGSITIPEGETSVDLVITPIDDEEIEETERVSIRVQDVDGNLGTADNQTASVIIEDNDVAPPIFSIEAVDDRASEAETSTGVFRITRDGDTTDAQVVNYQIATGNNQATNGVDYSELSGSITIPEGESSVNLVVTPIDDEEIEDTEGVTITVEDINGNLGTARNQTASLNIEDNDVEMLSSPVYRFQNSDVPGTYIFAGEQERDAINENFENFDEEGMAFQVATEPGDDLIPIYRFQSLANPGTYLFAGESEREGINENFSESFAEEGMAFYVYSAGTGQGTTFYRFHNTAQPGTYLFAGEAESANIRENFPDFVEEGAAFEVGV